MITLPQAKRSQKLFAPLYRGDSWDAWHAFDAALYAQPMTGEQAALYYKFTGRDELPREPFREAWVIAGRRAGKDRDAAIHVIYRAAFHDYTPYLADGETATVMLIAADRRQARVGMGYISGIIDRVPMLKSLVVSRTQESIQLSNRVRIEVHTCSFRAVRGYTVAAVVCDEIAFWRSDESVNPDTEIINALRPAMATIPGSLLLCISSPYSRRGALWNAFKKHYGRNDSPVLVWRASTLEMNPTVPQEIIDDAYREDAAAASAEYGGQFRTDSETFVSREVIESDTGDYRERAYDHRYTYRAFVDVAGGSGTDSYTLAIAHTENDRTVVDAVRETRPRFNPEQVTDEYCRLLNDYHITAVTGDKYAGSWPSEQFLKRGITYQTADKSKSDLYVDALPLFNAGRVTLPNVPRLINQICDLERRTGRGTGKDIVDHPPNSHDDLANVACGVLAGSTEKREVRSLYPSRRVRQHYGIRASRRMLGEKLMERYER